MMWRCYLYLKDSEYMLDGDLSEPRRGGGALWYTYITCQTLRLGRFFSGRLTKVDGRVVHSLIITGWERKVHVTHSVDLYSGQILV